MEFLYFLEKLRTPVLDAIFSAVTWLGSEMVFLVLAIVMYWCISKSRGLYLLAVGGLGTIANQFLKLACRVPRPWVRDPGFTIVESARADATGYSFPSGHTQNAVGTFGVLAIEGKKRWTKLLFVALAVLTALSRMYLGVHTPADVAVAALLAAVLVLGLHPLVKKLEEKPQCAMWLLLALTAINGLFVLYANFWNFPADMDLENLTHGVRNAAKLMGALLGMMVGYVIDLHWVQFRTKAPLAGQILKTVLGLLLLLTLKEGMKLLFGNSALADAVRYGLMTLFAGGLWPVTFPLFARIGRKKDV